MLLVEKACVENPCMNDGICHETTDGFHCECNQDWRGKECQGERSPFIFTLISFVFIAFTSIFY